MKLELRSVRIKNCGPIDDLKLDFFDAAGKTLPVCVIGGVNGSGKTTILEVIAWFAESLDRSLTNDYRKASLGSYLQSDWFFGDLRFSIYWGQLPSDVQIEDEHLGLTREPDGAYNVTATEKVGQLQFRINLHQKEPLHTLQTSPPTLERIPSLIFLPHNRNLEPVSGREVRKEDDQYQLVYRFHSMNRFPGSLTSYLIWLDYAYPERYAEIQQFLNDLDFDGKTFRVDRKTLSVVVKTASGHEHPLHELSSGEQNLLIILIELRRKLTPGSIVLIDEIENSLHPAFQHRLAQGLLALQREVPYQLIVTTHAPAFVEIFGVENTRLLTAF